MALIPERDHAFESNCVAYHDSGVIAMIWDEIAQLINALIKLQRTQMNFKRLSLTDIKIEINRVPRKKNLIEAMEKADVKNKWENSSWGRKLIVQKRRASLRIKKSGLVKHELSKLKRENAS
ncbi:60S ribosomal protein L14-2-like [Tripterygium wilfordii]|uniref:60S ribosomal protein L14-2-like n=1 Tax=Tripterygium wilfordii TaxID=458696 RepID=UPI0018F82969|nr:60S ribosomal protein L14-2-like [Tripterygium wilfordii]